MDAYVALVRGIGPSEPNMRNAKLRAVCEELGLENVASVLSSGNLVFETDTADVAALQASLERAWQEQLGFVSTTIIRRRSELHALVDRRPFGDRQHAKESYLLVTFAKSALTVELDLPWQRAVRAYEGVAATDRELFTVTDTTSERTPDVMSWIEQQFGTQVTSRTWMTVRRILERMA
jgi:uncharacterized protein (DUF1697 family)